MILTLAELDEMKHEFKPCDCGAEGESHQTVYVDRSNGASWRVNVGHHWWGGPLDRGLWWRTIGTSGARYFQDAQKALDFAKDLSDRNSYVLKVGNAVKRELGIAA